jgi:selenocysteine-specific elongation factor
MPHIIVGTAGHIDHGKTALVRALTGIDTDRLKEEKARGISIDLGFAHADLDGVTVGFVDVPGHERFVRNMLAGATGIDVVLFAVAANESVMPQTREHFAICRLLGIEQGVIALTKADLADEETLSIARAEAAALVEGSFLEGAPMVAVSSVTGAGLAELRRALSVAAREARAKRTSGFFRLPVDRAFAVRGFGAVVTGTVVSGSVRSGEEVEIYPRNRRARVRGIQVHGQAAGEAKAGQRAALNLAGMDVGDLHRGLVAGTPGAFLPTADFGARVELLRSAPALRSRSPVHFHAGTAELEGELRWLDRDEASPGTSALFARIVLRSPALLLPGDRFVLRRFSPVETIGGGIVLDPQLAPVRRAALHDWLQNLDRAGAAEKLHLWARSQPQGVSRGSLIARSGARIEEIRAAGLIEAGDYFLTPAQLRELQHQAEAATLDFHQRRPLAPGIPKQELRNRVLPAAPPALFECVLRGAPALSADGELIRHQSHARALDAAEAQAEHAIELAFQRAGLAAPGAAEVLAGAGVDAKKAQALLSNLIREGRLVRISAELIVHASALQSLRGLLASRRGSRFGVPDFKGWTGVSRKFAIPLLEYCDRQRLTRREGDSRLVL